MSALETFLANLAHAVATGENVRIGGGSFGRSELRQALTDIRALQTARDAAQARANNAESEAKRWLRAFDKQLASFNALHGKHSELVAALATVARFAEPAE